MKWNMKWYIFEKIRCVLVDVFWTKTCFLVHVTRGKRKRKKEEKILIWTMVFKEKKASVKGLIGIPWAFSGLCSSNSSPSQRGAAGTKEALSLATSLQLAQTCIWSVTCSSANTDSICEAKERKKKFWWPLRTFYCGLPNQKNLTGFPSC